jgi:hypothetical protein
MNNFKMEILEHRNPSTSPLIHVRNNCQPLQRLVVNPQKKEGLLKILLEMHYAPYKGISFSFHRMETLMDKRQSFISICDNILLGPFTVGVPKKEKKI